MNFINVKLVGSEIVSDGFRLKVPEGALKVLREKGYEGKELIFGIRPEDVNAEPASLNIPRISCQSYYLSIRIAWFRISPLLPSW